MIPKLTTATHLTPDLLARVERHNTEAAAIDTRQNDLAARMVELLDPATVTDAKAGERLKALAKCRADRLAALAAARDQADDGLAILADIATADRAEAVRLAEAMREGETVLRAGLAALGITEELACRRASFDDRKLNSLRGMQSQIGAGHVQREKAMRTALEQATAEIAAMLKQ